MDNKLDPRESLDHILDVHRKGIRDRMATFQTLQLLFEAQDDTGKNQICQQLQDILGSESLETRGVQGVGVNTPALALLALGAFGPIERMVFAAFSRVSLEIPKELEQWASEIGGGLQYALAQYPTRFTDQTLENMKLKCVRLRPVDKNLPLAFVQSLQSLERMVEHVQFQRFEESLRQSRKQQVGEVPVLDSLQGEFDPKIAADLPRQEPRLKKSVASKSPMTGDIRR